MKNYALLKRFKGKTHDEILDLANEITAPIRAKLKAAKTEEEKAPLRKESIRIAQFAINVANGAPNGILRNWPEGKPIPDYMEIVEGWVMPDHISPFFPGTEMVNNGCFYVMDGMCWNLEENCYEDE